MPDRPAPSRHPLRRGDPPRPPRGPDPAGPARPAARSSLVACEDTRRTGSLLRAHAIATPTTSYFEHNERWKGEQDPRRAAVGPRRRPRLRRGHAGHLRPGLPPRARRPGGGPAGRAGARPERRDRGPLGLGPPDRPLPLRRLPAPARRARAAGRSRSWPASGRRSSSTSPRCASWTAWPTWSRAARRPRRVPLPRGHEGARGVRARAALGAPRLARRARDGEGRDRAGRGRGARGRAGGRPATRWRSIARWPARAARGARRSRRPRAGSGRRAREVYRLVQEAEAGAASDGRAAA